MAVPISVWDKGKLLLFLFTYESSYMRKNENSSSHEMSNVCWNVSLCVCKISFILFMHENFHGKKKNFF